MKNDFEHYEKEFDDQVYEDEFYEENFDEKELANDEEFSDGDMLEDDDLDDDFGERKIHVSYACEDCDYRWEEVFIKKDEFDEDEHEVLCPMCGSLHVDQI